MSLAFALLIWRVYIRPYMIELGHDDTLILGGMTKGLMDLGFTRPFKFFQNLRFGQGQ